MKPLFIITIGVLIWLTIFASVANHHYDSFTFEQFTNGSMN